MARRRLGVVLLFPDAVAQQVDVLRRALGDGALGRVPPHITLVPPVNVRAEELDRAVELVRGVAASTPAFSLHLGPIATFAPVTPVLYLSVGGAAAALHRLREAVFHPPLERVVDHPFTPHVTVADDADEATIAGALAALGGFEVAVDIDRVCVLEEGDDRVWRLLADAPLAPTERITRGGVVLETTAHATLSPDAAVRSAQQPILVEVRAAGDIVGFARGRLRGARVWLDELWVAEPARGAGIGAELLRRFAREAATAGASDIVVTAGVTDAGFLVRMGFVAGSADYFTRAAAP